jgi:hypothetical protein
MIQNPNVLRALIKGIDFGLWLYIKCNC